MNSTRAFALTLAFLSGAAGLAHQLLWTRRLVDLLGASAETFAKVVGCFFIGLSLGAWLASRWTDGKNPWRRVALAELGVALLALPIIFLGWDSLAHSPGILRFKLLLPLLLVAPPALAMGLVLPWMIAACERAAVSTLFPLDGERAGVRGGKSCGAICDERAGPSRPSPSIPLPVEGRGKPEARRGSFPVWLYAINTLGGVAGILLVLLGALPELGLTRAALAVCGVNVFIAAVAFALGRGSGSAGFQPAPTNVASVTGRLVAGAPRLLAFGSGFLVLALEVIVQHQVAQVSINSLFSSATVLLMVVLALALASVPGASRSRLRPAGRWRHVALLLAALVCCAEPFLFHALRPGLAVLPYELAPVPYTLELFKLGALALGPLFLAAGLVFPQLLASLPEGEGRARAVGVLLAWNGLGGWLGAECAHAFLAPHFGLWSSVVVIALGYLLLFIAAPFAGEVAPVALRPERGTDSPRHAKFSTWAAKLALIVAGVFVISAAAFLARRLPQTAVVPGEHLVALQVGREGVVATVHHEADDWRILFNNSYTLGGSRAQFNQERQAHLPLLLHGRAKSVACLGVATGSTVAGAALHRDVERIEAVELSPLVLEYARDHFAPFNRRVFEDARVMFVEEDARLIMAQRAAAYDVVIGDLFLPWRTGEGRLFAREHFANVRRALKPDGLFCQWLPMFQLTRPQFEAIARTFREVFPDAILMRGDFYTELPILGLVGGRNLESLDWPAIQAACARLRTNAGVTDPLARHAEGVAMMLVGELPAPPPGPVNTLGNAWLEWDAGRNILGLKTPWFVGVPCAELVRDAHRAAIPKIPEPLRAAHDAGQFFLTLEIATKLNLPVLEAMKSQVNDRLPAALRADAGADWKPWPARSKPEPVRGAENR